MLTTPVSISVSQQTELLHYLQDAFNADVSTWQRLFLCGKALGYLNERWHQQIKQDLPDLVSEDPSGVHVNCRDWLHCADVLQNVGRDWYDLGLFDGWRNEKFDVCDGKENLFALERALFRPLGLVSKAVHINGFTERDDELMMWIGKRSPFKAVDPDKLDNLVGGGVASGESLAEAGAREGFEEAGLSANITNTLQHPRTIYSQRQVSRGLHREYLSVYDVFLPPSIQPENQDGEVASFTLMAIPEIIEAMLDGRFMNDAMLVTLDGLLHQGWIQKDQALGQWLLQQRV